MVKYHGMNVIYACQKIESSIFLAGPTPRDDHVISWRPQALNILYDKLHYHGTVYVPEDQSWKTADSYVNQVDWENDAIAGSRVIVFWVPRTIINMPGFTTNVEFGRYVTSGKCVLGYPTNAPKMKYLHILADRFNCPVYHTLIGTLEAGVKMTMYDYENK